MVYFIKHETISFVVSDKYKCRKLHNVNMKDPGSFGYKITRDIDRQLKSIFHGTLVSKGAFISYFYLYFALIYHCYMSD